MKEKMLSIVIPCYNEEIRIQSTVSKVDEYMKNLVNSQTQKNVMVDYEIIVVNDGSKDGSAQRLAEIKLEHFRFISNAVNGGKGSVIKDGFKAAEGEYVLFMDADLATDLSAIKKALAVFEEQSFCAVVGSRKHRQSHIEGEDKWYRNLMSWGLNFMARHAFPIGNIKDTQCGFKAYPAVYAKMISELQRMDRFSFDLEHILIVRQNGGSVVDIPVHYYEQETSTVRPIHDTLRFLKDLVKIRKNYKKGLYKKHYERKVIQWED